MIDKLLAYLFAAVLLSVSPAQAAPGPKEAAPVTESPLIDGAPDLAVTPAPEIDLWTRLRDNMRLEDLDSPLVATQETWFVNRPAYLDTAFKRARLYLFHIVEAVEARGLPGELALLPVVESAYNPRALSPANASGIWQFIPSTGKVFGLKQNGWYDGRRDVIAATDAALDYLERLHGMFGRWELALAAYNCGEGCVARAIARNKARGLPTDYLSLDLPPETRQYVPKLMAVRNLVRDPEQYGVTLIAMPNQPYFQLVNLPYPIEAKAAARLAGMEMEDLLALNPGFRRHVIHAESQDKLLLPLDKLDTFQTRFQAEESQRLRLRSYTAQKGELLTRIADRFDVTVQWLKDHNPLEVKRGKLAQSQTLLLPPNRNLATAQARPVAQPVVARAVPRTHTVRKGDTLFSLAKRYQVSVADLRERNGALKILRPGDKLHIPSDG